MLTSMTHAAEHTVEAVDDKTWTADSVTLEVRQTDGISAAALDRKPAGTETKTTT